MKKWMVLPLLFFYSLNAMDTTANPLQVEQESFLSKSKKFLSYLAPYFTYKKNFIGVQLGIIAVYESLSLLSDFDSSGSNLLDLENFSKFHDSILKKMKFDKLIFLKLTQYSPIAGISSPLGSSKVNIITMDRAFYDDSSEAEKTFVIGHEISHAKNYHAEQKNIAALGILLGTSCALIAYDKITQALFKKGEKILKLHEKSYLYRIFHFIKSSNHVIATAPLVHWFLAKYLYYKFSQSLEIEADKESAQLLYCAQGGISFFEKAITKEASKKSKSWFSYLNPFTILKMVNHRCGFLNHPSDEKRIALLKQLSPHS